MKKLMLLIVASVVLVSCSNDAEEIIAKQNKEIAELEKELNELKDYSSILEDNVDQMYEESNEDLDVEKTTEDNDSDSEIELAAGTHYFGEDISPGRYVMKPSPGEKGNVRIRTEDDDFKDAVALGDGSGYSEKEYTFQGEQGDELNTATTIILYPK